MADELEAMRKDPSMGAIRGESVVKHKLRRLELEEVRRPQGSARRLQQRRCPLCLHKTRNDITAVFKYSLVAVSFFYSSLLGARQLPRQPQATT